MLADFILECTLSDEKSSKATEVWKAGESSKIEEVDTRCNSEELLILHVDGSSNTIGAGAGLILTNPKGDMVGCALHFEFPTTNNET